MNTINSDAKVTSAYTSGKFIKREKSSTSMTGTRNVKSRSRLSVVSRNTFGVSVQGGGEFLGSKKTRQRQFIKADNFGVRNIVKRSNFPAPS